MYVSLEPWAVLARAATILERQGWHRGALWAGVAYDLIINASDVRRLISDHECDPS